jgi:hypothetical protein
VLHLLEGPEITRTPNLAQTGKDSSREPKESVDWSQLNWRVAGSWILIAWGGLGGIVWLSSASSWFGRTTGWALVGNFAEILFLAGLIAAGIYLFQRYKE